ncbi:roadblock/LC7 domain-containing protein [Dokdonella sp.]|uniref:roadblock/LC7 domain-containing protein n=1 Tax=Dokdonella sp. TaxID=2291710 RepID=UPI002618C632|nr:roadblock/LC7 domain-containing protein [Dokdonella sp.]
MKRSSAQRVLRDVASKVLQNYRDVVGVQSAVLFSADGFELASYAADEAAAARLAAIGSSLAALGSAISAEAGLDEFERTTIESKSGTVTIMRVGDDGAMSLAVVAGRNAVLGQLLWATQRCSQALAAAVHT